MPGDDPVLNLGGPGAAQAVAALGTGAAGSLARARQKTAPAFSTPPSLLGKDAATVLLLHADGPDGSTSIVDSSIYAHPFTASGAAQISTAQAKFGVSSLKFDTSANTFATTPDSPDWAFGSGDFTIDFWVYFLDISVLPMTMIGQFPTAAGQYGWIVRLDNGNLRFYASADGTALTYSLASPWVPTVGQWYHVAAVRYGTVLTFYVNGTQLGGAGSMTGAIFDSTALLCVGGSVPTGSWRLNGHLDEIRVSKGIARWTSNFTPPSAPY